MQKRIYWKCASYFQGRLDARRFTKKNRHVTIVAMESKYSIVINKVRLLCIVITLVVNETLDGWDTVLEWNNDGVK